MASFIDVDPSGQRLKFLVQAGGVHMHKLQREMDCQTREVQGLKAAQLEREGGVRELTREVMRLLGELAGLRENCARLRQDHEALKQDHAALKQQLTVRDIETPIFDFYTSEVLKEQFSGNSSFGSPLRFS